MRTIPQCFCRPGPHGISPSGIGGNPDRHQQSKDHTLSYKEALKQQVKDKVHKHLHCTVGKVQPVDIKKIIPETLISLRQIIINKDDLQIIVVLKS